jgi:hypothetical protein
MQGAMVKLFDNYRSRASDGWSRQACSILPVPKGDVGGVTGEDTGG